VSAGTAKITVMRSGGSGGRVTVDYATSDGTAVAGVDYVATAGTLGFAPGVNGQTFAIPLINSGGSNRIVNLTLSNPGGGAVLVSPSTAVLTLQS
jgi:Calx-beta domain